MERVLQAVSESPNSSCLSVVARCSAGSSIRPSEPRALDEVIVVLGRAADEIREKVVFGDAKVVENPVFSEGCASSYRAGISALAPQSDAILILLGDQPGVDPETIDRVAEAWRNGEGECTIALASYQGRKGHPMSFAKPLFDELAALHGDKAAWKLVDANPDRVQLVAFDRPFPEDINTLEDFHRAAVEHSRNVREEVLEIQELLRAQAYVTDAAVATSLYLAMALGKPLLVEGPAGVGKTEIAKVLASSLGTTLVRLQCYEGLDASTALYEWNYSKQLLHIKLQETKATGATAATSAEQETAIFSEPFLLKRPLLEAITHQTRSPVLLIDEVDRSDEEFEAFLLEVLSEFQVTIPEIGPIKAAHRPHVVLTSNRSRDLSDALRRRCLYLWIDYPSFEKELEIVRAQSTGNQRNAFSRTDTDHPGNQKAESGQSARSRRDDRLGDGAGCIQRDASRAGSDR